MNEKGKMESDAIEKGVERAPNRLLPGSEGFTREEIRRPMVGLEPYAELITPGKTGAILRSGNERVGTDRTEGE